MKKLLSLIVFAVALSALPLLAQLPQDQIFHMHNPGVFMIKATGADGKTHTSSAFCLRQDGILVTTYHTIANASSATVRSIYDKEIRVLGTLATSPEHDLAILKIEDAGLSEVQIGQSEYTRSNEHVSIIASSGPSTNTYIGGKISAEYKKERAAEEYQLVIPVEGDFQSQYNGAPLLSGSGGRAMGVLLVADNTQSAKFAIAVPIEEVRTMLDGMSASPTPLSPAGDYFATKEGNYWAGRLDEVSGAFDNAIAHYRSALTAAPDFYPAIFQIAYTSEWKGDHATATEYYKKAQAYSQTKSQASYNLGLIDFAAGQYANAEQDFNTATSGNAKFLKAYDKLGETLEKEQQAAKALAPYMKARDIKPTDTYSNLRIANILFDEQKWRDAAKAAKTAREAGVDSASVYLIEADSWFHVRDYLQAWDLANRGTQRKSDIARFWYLMAASDTKTKNPDRAKTELDKLRALDPAAAKELESAQQ